MVSSDIQFRLSGGVTNTDPADALGDAMSTDDSGAIINTVPGNLFADVNAAEASAGSTKHRCFYVYNAHETETWGNVGIWISGLTDAFDTEFDIGVDPAGVNGGATTIADEDDEPTGVSFFQPTEFLDSIGIGDIPPGEAQAIWVRRIVQPDATSITVDVGTISFSGTPA
jgi:hypothetical protein